MPEGRGEAFDLLELANRRYDVLSHLRDGPASKPALVDGLDVSRSTVNRALRELEEWHLVERVDAEFRLTTNGRHLIAILEEYLTELSTLADANPILAHLPPEVRVPQQVLRRAEIYPAKPPSPTRVLDKAREHLMSATRCRCLVGEIAAENSAEFLANRVEEGMDFQVVFDEHILSFLLVERRDSLQTYLDDGEVYETDDIPYNLIVIDDGDDGGDATCVVIIYDEGGDLAGLLINDSPAAVEWAEGVFERYRDDATRLDVEV